MDGAILPVDVPPVVLRSMAMLSGRMAKNLQQMINWLTRVRMLLLLCKRRWGLFFRWRRDIPLRLPVNVVAAAAVRARKSQRRSHRLFDRVRKPRVRIDLAEIDVAK